MSARSPHPGRIGLATRSACQASFPHEPAPYRTGGLLVMLKISTGALKPEVRELEYSLGSLIPDSLAQLCGLRVVGP